MALVDGIKVIARARERITLGMEVKPVEEISWHQETKASFKQEKWMKC
jgi:hypothetical protein